VQISWNTSGFKTDKKAVVIEVIRTSIKDVICLNLAPNLVEDYLKQPWVEMGNGLKLYYSNLSCLRNYRIGPVGF